MEELKAFQRLKRIQQASLMGRGGLFLAFMVLSFLFGVASLFLWLYAIFDPSWWSSPEVLAFSTGGFVTFVMLLLWSYRLSQRQYKRLQDTQREVREITEMKEAQGGSISVAEPVPLTGQLSEAVDVGAISDAQEVAQFDRAVDEEVAFDFEQEAQQVHQVEHKHES